MVSKNELLGMLDRAMNHEEHIIVGWGYAINEHIPGADLTNEQKDQLSKITDVQVNQSLKHKEIFKKLFRKVAESGQDEF
jgi:3-mercaptopyruvate sulfurtransferase SseA